MTKKVIIVKLLVRKSLKNVVTKPNPIPSRVGRKRTREATIVAEDKPKKGVAKIIKPNQGQRLIREEDYY